ncbi:TylF/MycF family methyltransferase [Parapedobacter tibetensis]|uniref:TylF/MycF family methyltransferase n=1 Tax=Parapedobacter tibetensis TaxID=2972951 RepID=UPI00214DE1A7|nr:TylF/MycF family methyltransferase [Parapedobacter tibetensis]
MTIETLLTKAQAILYALTDKEKARLIQIKQDHLTYLATKDIFNLYRAVKEVEQAQTKGLFIEAGCALGGSAIAIGRAKKQKREFWIYDAFGLIPPPTDKDDADVHARYEEIKSGKSKGLGNNPYYGYTKNLQEVVTANLAKYDVPVEENNIKLIKGYFEDTLSIAEPVAFAHIDCDWYESVMTCLYQIVPNLTLGGKLVFDDYHAWSGCRHAVDKYFEGKKDQYAFATQSKKLHVTKIA